MKNPDYIALKKPGEPEYTWYDKNNLPATESGYPKADLKHIQSVRYAPSGQLITRPDGEVAEVWEAVP